MPLPSPGSVPGAIVIPKPLHSVPTRLVPLSSKSTLLSGSTPLNVLEVYPASGVTPTI